MEEHLQKTLEQMQSKLREQEQFVIDTKKMINQLCSFAGQSPLYADVDLQVSGAGLATIRRDSFYGKSVTTAAREYLEMRRTSSQGAATLDEIMDALKKGGFDFSTISSDEAAFKRGVAITLAKNSSIFHKLPNENWGLLTWYPEAKEKKQKKSEDAAAKEGNGKPGDKEGEETK